MINLLDNTPNQTSKFRRKNWVEINDNARGTYNINSQITFKTSTLNSSLHDFGNAKYILLRSGTITITGEGDNDAAKRVDEKNKGVIIKNCAPFTDCISEIKNIQIDNAEDIDVVMPMYNLIEYSDKYSKTPGSS